MTTEDMSLFGSLMPHLCINKSMRGRAYDVGNTGIVGGPCSVAVADFLVVFQSPLILMS